MFVKYQHLERFGTDETTGIELGTCYVFPKLDGTNGSIWRNEHVIEAGSRNRVLSLEKDNAGFLAWVREQKNIEDFFMKYPNVILYGEWLVPHTLKTYKDTAWRKFYVFDVCTYDEKIGITYYKYEEYKEMLEQFNIEYISPLRIIRNGSYEAFIKTLESNNYLIEDGKGTGEGIVIKNYEYQNKYKRQTWAKIVTSEFKEKHYKTMGAPVSGGTKLTEQSIVDKFCTEAFILKTFEKIKIENDGWNSKLIPKLIGMVWHDLITEECWNFIKEFKNPTINFKTLSTLVLIRIKQVLPNIF